MEQCLRREIYFLRASPEFLAPKLARKISTITVILKFIFRFRAVYFIPFFRNGKFNRNNVNFFARPRKIRTLINFENGALFPPLPYFFQCIVLWRIRDLSPACAGLQKLVESKIRCSSEFYFSGEINAMLLFHSWDYFGVRRWVSRFLR